MHYQLQIEGFKILSDTQENLGIKKKCKLYMKM